MIAFPFEDKAKEEEELKKYDEVLRDLIKASKLPNIFDAANYTILSKSVVVRMLIMKDQIVINGQGTDKIEFRKGVIVKIQNKDQTFKNYLITKPGDAGWTVENP